MSSVYNYLGVSDEGDGQIFHFSINAHGPLGYFTATLDEMREAIKTEDIAREDAYEKKHGNRLKAAEIPVTDLFGLEVELERPLKGFIPTFRHVVRAMDKFPDNKRKQIHPDILKAIELSKNYVPYRRYGINNEPDQNALWTVFWTDLTDKEIDKRAEDAVKRAIGLRQRAEDLNKGTISRFFGSKVRAVTLLDKNHGLPQGVIGRLTKGEAILEDVLVPDKWQKNKMTTDEVFALADEIDEFIRIAQSGLLPSWDGWRDQRVKASIELAESSRDFLREKVDPSNWRVNRDAEVEYGVYSFA